MTSVVVLASSPRVKKWARLRSTRPSVPAPLRARGPAQHLCNLTANDGAAAAGDERDGFRIAENVRWLERAQIKVGDPQPWAGSWSYSISSIRRPGDNSNSQYALLGLAAAGEANVPVDPSVWLLARAYWERCQQRDGSWTYTPDARVSTASMTCAGIASLAASRPRSGSWEGQEVLKDDAIHNCGSGRADSQLQRGIDWLGTHFRVDENSGSGKQWKFYYLYGLERAGRLTGTRYFRRAGLVSHGGRGWSHQQVKQSGAGAARWSKATKCWRPASRCCSSARAAPVLINKLRHGPSGDWNNDPDDVGNLVGAVSKDWKTLLTWQSVDSTNATVADLLRGRSSS